jgi:hypothetical protein
MAPPSKASALTVDSAGRCPCNMLREATRGLASTISRRGGTLTPSAREARSARGGAEPSARLQPAATGNAVRGAVEPSGRT